VKFTPIRPNCAAIPAQEMTNRKPHGGTNMAQLKSIGGIRRKLQAEEGAVTVDWVVLTASVVAMGMVAGAVIWNNSGSVAKNVSSYLASQSVVTTF